MFKLLPKETKMSKVYSTQIEKQKSMNWKHKNKKKSISLKNNKIAKPLVQLTKRIRLKRSTTGMEEGILQKIQ